MPYRVMWLAVRWNAAEADTRRLLGWLQRRRISHSEGLHCVEGQREGGCSARFGSEVTRPVNKEMELPPAPQKEMLLLQLGAGSID